MATIEQKVSDLSGATEGVETYVFGLDGDTFEVDLTAEEFSQLSATLAVFVSAARRVGGVKPSPARRGGGVKRDPEQTRAMKDWLRANGYTVPDRGRISKELEEAYNTQTPFQGAVKKSKDDPE